MSSRCAHPCCGESEPRRSVIVGYKSPRQRIKRHTGGYETPRQLEASHTTPHGVAACRADDHGATQTSTRPVRLKRSAPLLLGGLQFRHLSISANFSHGGYWRKWRICYLRRRQSERGIRSETTVIQSYVSNYALFAAWSFREGDSWRLGWKNDKSAAFARSAFVVHRRIDYARKRDRAAIPAARGLSAFYREHHSRSISQSRLP